MGKSIKPAEKPDAVTADNMEAPEMEAPKAAAKKAKKWDVMDVLANGEKYVDPDVTKADYDKELVPYKIPRTKNDKDASVFVSVNGRSFSIPKGQEVIIPRYIRQAHEDSTAQDNAAMEYIDANRTND